mgnify:CR=1 FL=1
MLRLYWADVSRLSPDADEYELSAYRREKLRTLRPPDARKLSIGAELLLRHALFDCAPEITWPPVITAGEHGKPDWNVEGPYFNLSHSGHIAACVIADRPVGLDVQKACEYREALARRFFSAAEQAFLAASADKDRAFGLVWSRKEAYVKALGTGFTIPHASFSAVGEQTPENDAFWDAVLGAYTFAICLPGARSAEPDVIIEKQLP